MPKAGPEPADIRTILFDLDGTLLKVDVEAFFPDYFSRVVTWITPHLDPDEFLPRLMRSTAAMIADRDPGRTNREVFMAHFFDGLELGPERLMPVFDAFYDQEFPKLRKHAEPIPGAADLVRALLAEGRRVVIATSPVFPPTPILERLRWAGLENLPFTLVTHYENMHFCKPHPEYYAEILERVGARPEECLMVGNDVEEDLAARDAGIRVFLAGPEIIHRGRRPMTPDYSGTIEDLAALLAGGRTAEGDLPRPAARVAAPVAGDGPS